MNMKKTVRRSLALLLLFTMILSMIPAFSVVAADEGQETYDLTAEGGNLARLDGVEIIYQYEPHADVNWDWDYKGLNDGDMNVNADKSNGGYHSNTGYFRTNHSEWVGYKFPEPQTIDTLVVYPCLEQDGATPIVGMPNAFAVEVSLDGNDWVRVYEEYCFDAPSKFGPQAFSFEEVTVSYVRFVALSLNRSDAGTWAMKLCEMAVYNTDYVPVSEPAPVNILRGAKADSNSSHTDGPWNLININDGDRYNLVTTTYDYGQFAGYHTSPSTAAGTDVYISFDLGGAKYVDQLVIVPGTEKYSKNYQNASIFYFPTDFEVQVSDDGNEWKTVASESDYALTEYKDVVIDFERTEASYIRFYMKAIPGYIKLSEIEAYDTETLVTPGETVVKPGVNLAYGASATASSYISDQSWSPALLVNGIIEESGGFTTQNVSSAWVGVSFDSPTVVNTMKLYSASTGGDEGTWSGIPEGFKIEYTTNGLNWYPVSDVTLSAIPSGQEAVEVSFETVTVKGIRINSDTLYPKPSDGGRTYIQLAEMELFYDPYKLGSYDSFAAYYQKKEESDSTHAMRVIIAASENGINALTAGMKVKVTFNLEDGTKKSTEGTLGEEYSLFRSVMAAGDQYTAVDGCALFGCVITGIPNDAYQSITVEITDTVTGSVIFSAQG